MGYTCEECWNYKDCDNKDTTALDPKHCCDFDLPLHIDEFGEIRY